MKIRLRTNLDYMQLPPIDVIPPKGAYIMCMCGITNKRVKLEVASIVYSGIVGNLFDDCVWEIELTFPSSYGLSLKEWYKKYCDIYI